MTEINGNGNSAKGSEAEMSGWENVLRAVAEVWVGGRAGTKPYAMGRAGTRTLQVR